MKVVIMAGGRGTRISELFPDIPKPLIPIDGVPVLEREICSLREQGFVDYIFTVSHTSNTSETEQNSVFVSNILWKRNLLVMPELFSRCATSWMETSCS